VETIPERVDPSSEPARATSPDRSRLTRRSAAGSTFRIEDLRWVVLVYLGTRLLLLVVAVVDGALRHHNFTHELANWDGLWYRELANHGYPAHAYRGQTTLGFFPLYPIVMWVVAHSFSWATTHGAIWSITVAGAIISGVGGLVATILVYRLAMGWWDKCSARRATALFCLFPGSVVFSMVYAEGLLIPLAAGCIFALERRRWVLAGLLAGFATAVQPDALVLVPVCATSALLEFRRRGWRYREARRSLLAPLLSLSGVSAVALFLWAWTGSPFATFEAQHHGWGEKTDALALWHLTKRLAHEISFKHFNHPTINLNLVVGLVGAVVLVVMLVFLWKARRQVSVEAIVWTLGIAFLCVTSEFTPPNPRLLFTAFPALLAIGHYIEGRKFSVLLWINGVLLTALSFLTFVGYTLRP
jgi:Mannosyltransferase (PIG-V)